MKFFYARTSTKEQNLDRQLETAHAEGIPAENIYTDQITGTTLDRPGLNELLKVLREGDTVYIHSLDRLSRNLSQALNLIEQLDAKGVAIVSVTEGLSTQGAGNKLVIHTLMAVNEYIKAQINKSCAEGRAAYIERCRKTGEHMGRPAKDADTVEAAIKLYIAGTSVSKIEEQLDISRSTLYRELKKRNISR